MIHTRRLILITLCAIFLASSIAQAQTAATKDSLSIGPSSMGGSPFIYGGKRIPTKQVGTMLASHPDAFRSFNQSRSNQTIALLTSFTGGFLIGYFGTPLLFGGGEVNKSRAWTAIGVGAGFVCLGIHLEGRARLQRQKAVDAYNALK